MIIKYKKFDKDINSIIPEYQTEHSSGMDLCSSSMESIIIKPGEYKLIPTNLILEIPEGYEGQVRPRSGLALKNGITVLKNDFEVKFGDRIAQLIISKYEKALLKEDNELTDTNRGSGGYGSTGK